MEAARQLLALNVGSGKSALPPLTGVERKYSPQLRNGTFDLQQTSHDELVSNSLVSRYHLAAIAEAFPHIVAKRRSHLRRWPFEHETPNRKPRRVGKQHAICVWSLSSLS